MNGGLRIAKRLRRRLSAGEQGRREKRRSRRFWAAEAAKEKAFREHPLMQGVAEAAEEIERVGTMRGRKYGMGGSR